MVLGYLQNQNDTANYRRVLLMSEVFFGHCLCRSRAMCRMVVQSFDARLSSFQDGRPVTASWWPPSDSLLVGPSDPIPK